MRIRVSGLVATTLAVTLGFVATTRAQAPAAAPKAAAAPTSAAAPKDAPAPKTPRTPWGDPDLQGTWDYRTITPLERAREFGTREFYTEEEKKALESSRRPSNGRSAGRDSTGSHTRAVLDGSGALHLRWLPHVADRRPARRPHSRADRRRQGSPGARAQPQQCGERVVARPRQSGALHHLRAAERQPAHALQQQHPDRAGARLRGDRARDDSRGAGRAARRPLAAERARPGMDRRLARPLGRRHAGRRDDEFQRQEQLPRVDDRSASHRALHACRCKAGSSFG